MSNGTFDFNVFLQESKETILNPKSYFSAMKTAGGIAEPLIKAVLYGTCAAVIFLVWDLLNIRIASGSFFGGYFGFYGFIKIIIVSVIGVFIGAVLLLIVSSLCKGNTDFEANLRVTASVMVVMPISVFLGFTTDINFYLGAIVSIGVYIYAMWLLYNGLVEALKCDANTSKIACYVLIGIMVLFTLIGMSARNKAVKYSLCENNILILMVSKAG